MLNEQEKMDFIDRMIDEMKYPDGKEIPAEQCDPTSNKNQIEDLKTLVETLESLHIATRQKIWDEKTRVESERSETEKNLEKSAKISSEFLRRFENLEAARIELTTSDIEKSVGFARELISTSPRDSALYGVLVAVLRIKWVSRLDDSVVRGFVAGKEGKVPFQFDSNEVSREKIIGNIWELLHEGRDFF